MKIQQQPKSQIPLRSAPVPCNQPRESDCFGPGPGGEAPWLQQVNQLRHFAPAQAPGFDPANMDLSVDRNQDFYAYAMGTYLKQHPIPESKELWGIDSEVQLRVQNDLTAILDRCAAQPQDSQQKQLGDFYRAGLDQAGRDARGLQSIQPLLDQIEGLQNNAQIPGILAQLQKQGISALFSLSSGQDAKDQSQQVAQLYQGGLGLPNCEYYSKTDAESQQLRVDYRQHISRTLQLTGIDAASADAKAQRIFAIEERLAASSLKPAQLQETESTYHPIDRGEFEAAHPRLGMSAIFEQLGLGRVQNFNEATPDFFKTVETMLADTPGEDWKDYLKWSVLEDTASSLSTPFVQQDFAFRSKLSGVQAMPEPKESMVKLTTESLGDSLSKLYVAEHFTPETRAKVDAMVGDILHTLKDAVGSAPWMGEATKAEAGRKIDLMRYKIGYPEKWRDSSAIDIRPDDHAGNVLRTKAAAFSEDLERIGAPVDSTRWLMQATEVNAYYDPSNNEFVFPAAILQPPYFDPKADAAINYGATGATIGHEITHGFDDEGRKFDAVGNLREWWSQQDLEAFQQRANRLKAQYEKLSFQDIPVNGDLILGEALADLGGIELAYGAFEKRLQREGKNLHEAGRDGFTPAQRFFLSYAQSWATNLRPETAKLRMENDPHPLPEFRVNAILANFPPFHRAFQIEPGSPMGRPEADQNRLWT